MAVPSTRRKLRLTVTREELVTLIYALEDMEESYKHDGGLALIEDEMRLCEKLEEWLRSYDRNGKRGVKRGAA